MKTDDIREKYLQFFQSKDHRRCDSDVLVPKDDESVLFTPAGMNQFKDHFLGKVELEFTRATTCQKCFRTGDIDNVGRTAFHHTFFEMLGNFSFGDYFKKEAILWAWEFLTGKDWLAIDPDRLFVTVYLDDDEAADIWQHQVGLPVKRILRKDEDENFWPASAPSQGPNGVCGPCSEIYYQLDDGSEVEIWNLVFTQFNRVGDPPDNLKPLPSKNIDTGMGLERIASVLQGVPTNYHIDSLMPIVLKAGEICQVEYSYDSDVGRRLRRITDHVRAATFAIHENVVPSNEKQGYQIRLLLRRAILDAYQMGIRQPSLYRLVPTIIEKMSRPYPELADTQSSIQSEIKREEEQYLELLSNAVPFLEREMGQLKEAGESKLDGATAFNWYQTNGIPQELMQQMCERLELDFDREGYTKAREQHAIDSGAGQKELFSSGPLEDLKAELQKSEFLGYETSEAQATVKGIIYQNQRFTNFDQCDTPDPGNEPVLVVLDRSPFYAESGGQVGDSGWLLAEGMRFEVLDTQKASGLIVHQGVLREGVLENDLQLTASVDFERREAIRRAHSATHLLHYALQQNVGQDAQQRGSRVQADELRFDFKCDAPIPAEQLRTIESRVREAIAADDRVAIAQLPIADARKAGAMMLFGEKYPDVVRMVSIGDYSKELCGGTHLENMAELEAFELLSDESVSAGTRRITAITGKRAQHYASELLEVLQSLATTLGVEPAAVVPAVESLRQYIKDARKRLSQGSADVGTWEKPKASQALSDEQAKSAVLEVCRSLNASLETANQRLSGLLGEIETIQTEATALQQASQWDADSLIEMAEDVDGVRVIVAETAGANNNLMRGWIDQIRKKDRPAAIFLATALGDAKVLLIAGLTRDLVDKGLSAGSWVKEIAPKVGGGGGGKPDLAQAGGKEPENIKPALEAARQWMKSQLAN